MAGGWGMGIGPALFLFAKTMAKQTQLSPRVQAGVQFQGILVDIVQMK